MFHSKHGNLSIKLFEEIQNLQYEVNWENIFNEENSYRVISSVANQFVHDINKLIYDLHQIMIKIIANQSSYQDLNILVKKLSHTSCDLQEVFGQECLLLKSQMIVQIRSIVEELSSLFCIVENEELCEYKTELVDSLSEILSNLQKVFFYNHLKQLTSVELEEVFRESEEECRNLVAENHLRHETNMNKTMLEGLVRHTFHGVISVQGIIFHFHKVANNYSDPIKKRINQIAKDLNKICMDLTVGMYEMKNGGEGTSPLQECINGGFQAFREMRQLINCDESGNDSENLNNLIFYALSTTLCMAKRFARDINAEVMEIMM